MAVAELTGAGATIGTAIYPGVGTAIGAAAGFLIGAGIDIFNFFNDQANQKAAAKATNDYNTATIGLQLDIAKQNAGAEQDFLNAMPKAGDALTKTTGDTEFDQQYRQMLAQFGNVNAIAGATGRVGVGTSMQAVGQEAQQVMTDFVSTQKEQATRQLGIYKTTIDTLTPAYNEMKAL